MGSGRFVRCGPSKVSGGGLLGGAVNAVIERSTAARAGIRHITVVVAEQSRAAYAATGVSVPIFVNSALSIFPFAHDLFLLIFVFGLPSSAPGGHSRRTAPAGRFGLGFGSGDAEIIGVLLAAPLAAVGLDGFCVGLYVTGEPDHRRGGGCALDGGRQAVHLCPAGRDDLGGGLGFDGLGGGLFRLGFVLPLSPFPDEFRLDFVQRSPLPSTNSDLVSCIHASLFQLISDLVSCRLLSISCRNRNAFPQKLT